MTLWMLSFLAARADEMLVPSDVRVAPTGDLEIGFADGTTRQVAHDAVRSYLASCDAIVCDLVARTDTFAVRVGSVAMEEVASGSIFGVPCERSEGRLPVALIAVSGSFRPVPPAARPEPPPMAQSDKDAIDRVFRRNRRGVRLCYRELLRRDPDARGKVTVKVVIDAHGAVSSATIKNTQIDDEAFGTCMTSAMLGLRFPEPRSGGIVIVSYPFVFGTAR